MPRKPTRIGDAAEPSLRFITSIHHLSGECRSGKRI